MLNDRCSSKGMGGELIYYLMCLPTLRGFLCFGLTRISDSYLKHKATVEVGQLSTGGGEN